MYPEVLACDLCCPLPTKKQLVLHYIHGESTNALDGGPMGSPEYRLGRGCTDIFEGEYKGGEAAQRRAPLGDRATLNNTMFVK